MLYFNKNSFEKKNAVCKMLLNLLTPPVVYHQCHLVRSHCRVSVESRRFKTLNSDSTDTQRWLDWHLTLGGICGKFSLGFIKEYIFVFNSYLLKVPSWKRWMKRDTNIRAYPPSCRPLSLMRKLTNFNHRGYQMKINPFLNSVMCNRKLNRELVLTV